MGLFEAVITQIEGRRAVELTHRLNAYDHNPRRLTLIVRQPLTGLSRLPFAYQYLESAPERPFPTIVVVAAPGVSVVLENYPDTFIASEAVPAVDIYRVQDPELIPPLGSDLTSRNFVGDTEIPSQPAFSLVSIAPPTNYFQVKRLDAVLAIKHVFSNTEIILTPPQLTRTRGESRDAQARFAYEIDPEGRLGSTERPLLRIVKTPAVDIGIADRVFMDSVMASLGGPRVDPSRFLAFWEVYEVDDVNQVPPQGQQLVPERHWRLLRSLPRREPLEETLAMAAFDVSIGFVPYVGDAVDIAEFVYGIVAGRDRWGRRVTTGDLVIMGIGAALPFVSGALLRNGGRLLRAFGRRADTAVRLAEDLARAGLGPEDVEVIRRAEDIIRSGRQLPADLLQRYAELLARIRGRAVALPDLVNAGGNGFVHVDLQEAYQAYRSRQLRAGQTPASPTEWAIRQTSGRPRQILEGLLGADYARGLRSGPQTRWVNVVDVPRQAGYTDALVDGHLQVLGRQPGRVTDRLQNMLDALREGNPITRFLARRRLNAAHFRILKGNIAEILSMDLQRTVLRRIQARHPDARIISGVRVRMMEGTTLSRAQLFSDNIIAVERNGNLEVLAVFEVKSGYQGGQEATMQIFEWLERRLEQGSELVLPRGARVMGADGAERVLDRPRTFRYDPTSTDRGRAVLLFSAERHIVTAQGASHLGIDSAMRVAPDVQRHALDLTSEQLDFLTTRVFAGLQ